MLRLTCLLIVSFVPAVVSAASLASERPYAGQHTRPVKALSAEQTEGLLAGAGLGYAKAAELNGWPGPLHALDLRDALALSPAQIAQLTEVREAMLAEARPLGTALVEAERRLDAVFAEGEPRSEDVLAATTSAAAIEGRLRAVHLTAHIATRAILSRHQRMLYAQARGYTDQAGHGGMHQ